MRYSNPTRRYKGERESVDHYLDRLMDTIRGELEKDSPDDLKKLITKRRRMERRQAKP